MAIENTDIVKEYGAYYINEGQNISRLYRKLLFDAETTKYAKQVKTENTVYHLADSELTEIVQGFQTTWTPKGDLRFKPNPIQLYNMKVDVDIYPDDIKNSWLGFLDSENLSRKEWPLVRYMMEYHLVQRIKDDMERNAYYKGVYKDPTPGTAGAASESMNGLGYILANAEGINRVSLSSALDPTTIYDQIEEFYEMIAEEYQNTKMIICMAPKWKRAFLKDKRAMGYYDISGPDQIDDTLDFSPARVIGLPSMIGVDDIWATPANNFLHPTKYFPNSAKFKVEEYRRCVSILTDWWEGLGFGLNQAVWTTASPATETPAGDATEMPAE